MPLSVSKDLINELWRLAREAQKDTDTYEKAHRQLVTATGRSAASTANFATALYDFTLRHADQTKLIAEQLNALKIKVKSTSSVYYCISRLAFANEIPADSDVSLSQVTKYADLIEAAHSRAATAEEFARHAEVGIARVLQAFAPKSSPEIERKVELGRDLVKGHFASQEVELDQIDLPSWLEDGEHVELVARVEKGKLVVYGLLPPSLTNVDAVLQRIGTKELADKRRRSDLFSNISRTIKLVAGKSNVGAVCALALHKDKLRILVQSGSDFAACSLPGDQDFLDGSSPSFAVPTWLKMCEMIAVLKGYALSFSHANNSIVVEVADTASSLTELFRTKKKAIVLGSSKGTVLTMPYDPLTLPKAPPKLPAPKTLALSVDQLGGLTKHKPNKLTYLHWGTEEVEIGDKSRHDVVLSKGQFLRFASILQKFGRLADTATVDTDGRYVRVSATNGDIDHLAFIKAN